jgi:hypothetical protein
LKFKRGGLRPASFSLKIGMKISRKLSIVSVILLIAMTVTVVVAQKGVSVVTRIKFAKGRTTSVQKSSINRGVSHDYLLRASSGQSMTVHLAASGGVCFDLFTPGRSEILAECSKDWSGELPQSGDYRINVLPDTTTERKVSYTLEVTVR